MWARNLLFVGIVAGGVLVLAGSLRPLQKARAQAQVAAATLAADEDQTVKHFDALNHTLWRMDSVTSAAPAPDLAILRRLNLALLGTIPSIEEIRRFEELPPADRIQTWLAHLFEDRRYADYLAERLARAYVGTEDGPFIIFRRRRFVTWLSDELARNQPYDAVVRSLISEEGLWTEKPATNFVTVTFQEDKNGFNPERLAARVARGFLGVRLDCAQCHDHPFQPWKQSDFMGLAAYFGQVERGFTGLYEDSAAEFHVDRRKNGRVETVAPRVPFAEECVPDEGSRRSQLANWVTDPKNRWFARATVNRIWTLLLGKALVEPVDDIPSAGEPPQTLELLAEDFAKHGYDLRRLIRIIVATEVFQLDSSLETEVTPAHEKLWAVFPLTRLRPEQVVGGIMQTGSLETLDAESPIVSRFFAFVGGRDFVQRYGDTGEDEFNGRGGTIPQRLLLMNGDLVEDKTKDSPFNAATRIGMLAPDDRLAVETAYLAVLTRRPTEEEAAYFGARLAGTADKIRHERMGDLYWTLLNSTEFSWNH